MPPSWKQSSSNSRGGFPPWELQVPAGCLGDKTEEKREIIDNRRLLLPVSVSVRRGLSWSSCENSRTSLHPSGLRPTSRCGFAFSPGGDARRGTKDSLSAYFKFSSFSSVCLLLFSFQSSQVAAIFILSRSYSYTQWGEEKQYFFYSLNTWNFKYLLRLLCVKIEKLLLCRHPKILLIFLCTHLVFKRIDHLLLGKI